MSIGDVSQDVAPQVTLRIPGVWREPEELTAALPPDCELQDHHLRLHDGSLMEWSALPADDQFAGIFAGSCPRPPSPRDQQRIENYRVNFCLTGPGGSVEAAARIQDAGVAILDAGGAGVFIDNSGLAHGSDDWRTLARSSRDGGVFWAFVTTVRSERDMYTVGMHVLGYRDAIMRRTGDDEHDHFVLNNFLGYTYQSGRAVLDGDVLGHEVAPMYQVHHEPGDGFPSDAPMHNPYGRWRLKRVAK